MDNKEKQEIFIAGGMAVLNDSVGLHLAGLAMPKLKQLADERYPIKIPNKIRESQDPEYLHVWWRKHPAANNIQYRSIGIIGDSGNWQSVSCDWQLRADRVAVWQSLHEWPYITFNGHLAKEL